MEYFHSINIMVWGCCTEVLACMFLSILYVSSLYIWNSHKGRDHPPVIMKRFVSVFFMTCVSPLFLLFFMNDNGKNTLLEVMGFRWDGILSAICLPFALISILFAGPIIRNHEFAPITSTLKVYLDPDYWCHTMRNPIWWRNQVVAPFSEEFTFRACMVPLLLQCMAPIRVVFVAPLFFGVAHVHHAVDRIRMGLPAGTVIIVTVFQFTYTSLFGFFTTFLFIRTGHFLPLFIVHAFCNHMGVPEFGSVLSRTEPKRSILILFYFLGFLLFYYLLLPLTEPSLYSNGAIL